MLRASLEDADYILAVARSILARICAALWPLCYVTPFIGGSIAVGLGMVIVYETVRFALSW